jgi:hypothetical protein
MRLMINNFNVIHNRRLKDDMLYLDGLKEPKNDNIILDYFVNQLLIFKR